MPWLHAPEPSSRLSCWAPRTSQGLGARCKPVTLVLELSPLLHFRRSPGITMITHRKNSLLSKVRGPHFLSGALQAICFLKNGIKRRVMILIHVLCLCFGEAAECPASRCLSLLIRKIERIIVPTSWGLGRIK